MIEEIKCDLIKPPGLRIFGADAKKKFFGQAVVNVKARRGLSGV